jgi:hypothetical protein
MTGTQTLLARGALGAVGSLTSLALLGSARLRTLSNDLFSRFAVGGLALSRLGLFSLVYFILHLAVRGDIPSYYVPEGTFAMHGRLPYRDFISSYAPLHPYLDAAVLRLWYSPLSIVLLAILAECALLPLWLAIGRRLFPEQELRVATLFYLANPMSLIFVAIDGQDNVIIAMLAAAALALLIRRSEALSGAAVALALSAIKILPLLFTPIFFLATPRRWRWAVGAIAIAGVVYGTALAFHLSVTQPLTNEGSIRTAGNLPYVIESILGRLLPKRLLDGTVLLALCVVLLLVARTARGQTEKVRLLVITFGMPAIILTLVLLSKKGWPNYLMLILFPLCLLARRMQRSGIVLFSLFGIIAVVEHSYWSSLLMQCSSLAFHGLLFDGGQPLLHEVLIFGHGVLELLLIAGYCWLLALSLREIAAAPRVALGSTSHPDPDAALTYGADDRLIAR